MAIIQSGATTDLLTVDPTSKAARVALYDANGNPMFGKAGANLPSNPNGLLIGGVNDGAYRPARLDRYGNLRMGMETLLFRDVAETGAVSGTPIAPNLNQWSTAVSGFAVGLPILAGNQLTATTVTTASAYAIATSLRQFQKLQKSPLYYRQRVRAVIYANTIAEWGFGAPATVTAIVNTGAFWRIGSSGAVTPVISYNNSEITGSDISSSLNNANYYTWEIVVDDDSVLFVCQDVSTGRSISEQTLSIPIGQHRMWALGRLPIFNRVWNSGVPGTAPTFLFSDTVVMALDNVTNKAWGEQLVSATQGGLEVYPGAFVAANAQNANYANSAAPASATLSNTAAGYTTLGGQWQFVAVAGAETDYALFAFTVPTGFTLYVKRIRISTSVIGAASGGSSTSMQWAVANNSSAVSLATAGLTRTTVGYQTIPVSTPVGWAAPDIETSFDTALRTDGGRIFHVILKMPVGSATASEVIRGTVGITGYFE